MNAIPTLQFANWSCSIGDWGCKKFLFSWFNKLKYLSVDTWMKCILLFDLYHWDCCWVCCLQVVVQEFQILPSGGNKPGLALLVSKPTLQLWVPKREYIPVFFPFLIKIHLVGISIYVSDACFYMYTSYECVTQNRPFPSPTLNKTMYCGICTRTCL